MPDFTVTNPNTGQKILVRNIPEGATKEQIMAYVKEKAPRPERTTGDYANDVMMSGVEGLQDLGEMAVDVGQWGAKNALPLTMVPFAGPAALEQFKQNQDKPEPEWSKSIDIVQDRQNKAIADSYRIPEGESEALDKARTFTRFAAETAPMGGGNILRRSIGAGLGAVTGEELGGDMGEIMGGILGGSYKEAIALTRKIGQTAEDTGKFLKNTYNKLTGRSKMQVSTLDTADRNALRLALGRVLAEAYDANSGATSAEYVDELIKTIEQKVAAGERGSLGQLTGDRGLLQLEKEARISNRAAQQEAEAIDMGFQRGADEPMEAIDRAAAEAGGVPETAPPRALDVTRRRMDETRATAESAASAADQEAFQIMEDIARTEKNSTAAMNNKMHQAAAPPGVTVDQPGYEGFKQLKQGVNDAYNQAWGEAVATADVAGNVPAYIDMITRSMPKRLQNRLATLGDDIAELAELGPDGLRQIDRLIGDQRSMLARSTQQVDQQAARELKQIRDLFRQHMPPEVAARINELDKFYPRYKIVERSWGSAEKARPGSDMFSPEDFRKAYGQTGNPNTIPSRGAPMYDEAAQVAEEAEQFKQFNQQATESAKEAEARAAALRKQGEKDAQAIQKKTATGRFGQWAGEEFDRAVKEAYSPTPRTAEGTRVDPAQSIRELVESAGDDTVARESLRRAFVNEMQNTISPMKPSGGRQLSRKGYETFKQRRKVLEESGLFSADELDRMDAGLAEAQKLFLLDEAGEQLAKLPEHERRLAEAFAAFAGAKLGATLMPGISLVGASIGSKRSTELLRAMTTEQVRDLAYQMTMNPEKFVEVRKMLEAAGEGGRIDTGKAFAKLLARAGIIVGAEQQE